MKNTILFSMSFIVSFFFLHHNIFAQCSLRIKGNPCTGSTLRADVNDNNLTQLVWKFNNTVVYTARRTGFYPEGTTAGTGLNYATSVFIDDSGNIYAADLGNKRILKYSPGSDIGVIVATISFDPLDVYVFKDTLYIAGG